MAESTSMNTLLKRVTSILLEAAMKSCTREVPIKVSAQRDRHLMISPRPLILGNLTSTKANLYWTDFEEY